MAEEEGKKVVMVVGWWDRFHDFAQAVSGLRACYCGCAIALRRPATCQT
jgi:hypothetical protein